MGDIYWKDNEIDPVEKLFKSERFVEVRAGILFNLFMTKRGLTIRQLKEKLQIVSRESYIFSQILAKLETDGEIQNITKKHVGGETRGVSVYKLGGEALEKSRKLTPKDLKLHCLFAKKKRELYPDLGL